MEVKIIAEGCERKLPSGATQAYPIGWAGDVSEETALRWIGEGRAELIGGEATLSQSQLAFLRSFADHAMAEIASQVGQVDDGEELVEESGEAEELPADAEVAQVLEDAGDDEVAAAGASIEGLPPEIVLEDEVAAAPVPAQKMPSGGKSKRR